MRALRLDFVPRLMPRWPGYALLAVAAVGALVVNYAYLNTARSLADVEIVVSRLERRIARDRDGPAPPLTPAAQTRDTGVVQRAAEVTRRLMTPWEKLFLALETLRHDNVALLAVEPDSTAGTVRISAEAKDAAAMLAYVEALRNSGLLTGVALHSHQVLQQSQYQPLRFMLAAQWMAGMEQR